MFLDTKKTRLFKRFFSFAIAAIMMIFAVVSSKPYKAEAATSVSQLKVVGSQLCDANGNAIQLKGMSSHGLQWYGDYMNYNSMKYIRDNWGANVVRAAMYTDQNGYISNPTTTKAKVKEIVQSAIDLNMYVIIDWHILNDNNPNTYKVQAKSFFEEMATTYKNYPNVIYEICNEPNGGVTWANDIKPYAEYIIPAIRAIDSDSVIIVGTSTWSQDVDVAASNPLSYSNVMYACHFYAGTHGQSLRDKINTAMSKGAAIFVSEWGTSDASGNGGPYTDASQTWIDYMASKKISWCNWSLCDKGETSAALKSGASKSGGWSDSDLTTSGLFIKKNMSTSSTTTATSQVSVPTFSVTAGTYSSAQTVSLSSSTSGATIYYTTDGSTPTSSSSKYTSSIAVSKTTTIKAIAVKSGMTNSNVASAAYTINTATQQVSAPTFSVTAGTYSSAQTVSLSSSTSGATIYYTTDGSTPTSSSSKYTSSIAVSKTATIKAIAVKSGMTNSNVASAAYTISTTSSSTSTSTSNSSVEVTYAIGNDWGSGATINLTIKNNGTTAINGWTLAWTQPTNQSIGNMWNGTYSKTGSTINVKNSSYNGTIAANGGTQTIGFNINYSGSNTKPTSITLNGTSCTVK